MTREEHLKKIVERCELAIESNKLDAGIETSIAGWKSTIAAIAMLLALDRYVLPGSNAGDLRDSIISAWPEELL